MSFCHFGELWLAWSHGGDITSRRGSMGSRNWGRRRRVMPWICVLQACWRTCFYAQQFPLWSSSLALYSVRVLVDWICVEWAGHFCRFFLNAFCISYTSTDAVAVYSRTTLPLRRRATRFASTVTSWTASRALAASLVGTSTTRDTFWRSSSPAASPTQIWLVYIAYTGSQWRNFFISVMRYFRHDVSLQMQVKLCKVSVVVTSLSLLSKIVIIRTFSETNWYNFIRITWKIFTT